MGCVSYSRVLGKGIIRNPYLEPSFGTHRLCDVGQDSSLSESWFSPLRKKDINFPSSDYPVGLLWEII